MFGVNWLENAMRMLFSMIDKIVYGLISDVYVLIVKIADVRVFDEATLGEFATRMYGLIAIFMAFKLILTFVNYAVNPESMTNEKTGGKKLITNIVISLVLLVAVPGIIFPLSRDIQTAILTENILPAIILGSNESSTGVDDYTEQNKQEIADLRMGRMLSYNVMSSFFSINSSICQDTIFAKNPNGTNNGGADAETNPELLKTLYMTVEDGCRGDLVSSISSDYGDPEIVVRNYERSYNQYSVKILLGGTDEYDLKLLKQSNGEYVFDYNFFISTIAGIFVAWMLIGICFKISVRTIKLAFLELVAPIPILSYIDEKSKAKTFNGWVKTCISTYIDLFVRLAAIFFAVYVIGEITTNLQFEHRVGTPGPLIKVFIIIGALMFAEELPKLLQDILGVKVDGSFSLNPLKGSKLASAAVFGGAGLAAGAALGGVANTLAAGQRTGAFFKHNRELNKKIAGAKTDKEAEAYRAQKHGWKDAVKGTGYGAMSILGGIGGAGVRSGFKGGKTGKFKTAVVGGVSDSSVARERRLAGGGGMRQKAIDNANEMMGLPKYKTGATSKSDDKIKRMKERLSNLKQAESSFETARMDLIKENGNLAKTYNMDDNSMKYMDTLNANGEITRSAYSNYLADNNMTISNADITEEQFKKFATATNNKNNFNKEERDLSREIDMLENKLNINKKGGN